MKILRITSNLVALAVLALGFTSMANAQATRTWVSGVGDDANPCSRTAPCKTFAGAISKTAVNGEIDCLDPGGFGQVTITKAITIDCDSGPGGILVGAGSGVVINNPTGAVILRSLNINCNVVGTNGVNVVASPTVHLLDMNIWGCSNAGVTVGASTTVNLTVKDSQIHDSAFGIQTSTTSGFVIGDFEHLAIYNMTTAGLSVFSGSHINIQHSDLFQNPIGINMPNGSTGGPTAGATGNTFSFNATCFQATTGGNIGASTNFITSSVTVFNANGGVISTGSDNVSYQNAGAGLANGPALTKI